MENVMVNVRPEFDVEAFVIRLTDTYRAKGYIVNVINMNGAFMLSIEKGIGGINTVLGLGESIKANVMVNNGVLTVNFTDAEWTSKIIGLVLGWFLCLIPFITGIVGAVRQSNLPKNIANDARMIAMSM